ncbi:MULTISPECIES: ABC transporter ATP-binding protein [unclassified Pantoea]|uniref:ABC transporter ATP-binding protein n=1 Tax=unclassified Pantoea TaxID=2630326 RepID=UPI001CD40923|nr:MULTISPECIES: ABC transporter ATP-binding protein [unclassified Pantoea]MCA1176224.1 ABC transporter ATP-binding protein [Pantoea sp. alder69]MCA1249194.1 ABC transporter ATP-binding protein [Pantoea sp. alder70]MCA1264731.1 ABC transporter ATP-binding protein [Pantoea sp. alder81]
MTHILVSGVGKAYKIYQRKVHRLMEWIIPGIKSQHSLKWILKDINFEINEGEAVGIIGINGAGKSTLLKLITGTAKPTTGNIDISGRVAAMLELGMGFHADFTGRQNVYMSGQLLGLSVEQINQLMPEIESFAEIDDYIDQPVRVYSSGMQVRLAFSVATAIRPDILIIDEALSVGDAYFQHKSFERIREFRRKGTTLLLVSHDKQAIQSICDRAILLNKGEVAMEGEPEAVMDFYNALLADKEKKSIKLSNNDGKLATLSGTGEARISRIELLNENNESIESLQVGQAVSLKVQAEIYEDIDELVVGYVIKDRLGQPVFGTNTHHMRKVLSELTAGKKLEYTFSFDANLGVGSYSIAVALHSSDTHVARNYEWRDLALVFTVVNSGKPSFIGVAWMPPQLEIKGE